MSLLGIILAICALGVLLWLINAYLPMDGKIKTVLNMVVIIVLVVWLMKVFGLWQYLGSVHV